MFESSPHEQALRPDITPFGLSKSYHEAAVILLERIADSVEADFGSITPPETAQMFEQALLRDAQEALSPALFLVRHTVELRLKEVLRQADELADLHGLPRPGPAKREIHNLQTLWSELRNFVRAHVGHDRHPHILPLAEILDGLDTEIDSAHRADPRSISFRYPVTKNLPHVGARQILSDLRDVVQSLDEVDRSLVEWMAQHDG